MDILRGKRAKKVLESCPVAETRQAFHDKVVHLREDSESDGFDN